MILGCDLIAIAAATNLSTNPECGGRLLGSDLSGTLRNTAIYCLIFPTYLLLLPIYPFLSTALLDSSI